MAGKAANLDEGAPATVRNADGVLIAYHHTPGKAEAPGVVFLGGFMSDMTGTKAVALEAHCKAAGIGFTRLDYEGHGASGGAFEDGTIGRWTRDALTVLDEVTDGPLILVGSSMGGWIMLLSALRRPERVVGLIGIAPAPDFVLAMADSLDDRQKRELDEQGRTTRPTAYDDDDYVITKALIEDGRQHLLMEREIPLDVPVRILHGILDDAVPWQRSLQLGERLRSDDVRTTFVKAGDHRLSTDADIDLLTMTLDDLIRTISRT